MAAILISAAGILATVTLSGAVFADPPLVKDPGASGFTPKEEPKSPGWDPNGASEDAPGKEAPHCIGCAKDLAPGSEGLELGIIGPD